MGSRFRLPIVLTVGIRQIIGSGLAKSGVGRMRGNSPDGLAVGVALTEKDANERCPSDVDLGRDQI